MKEPEFELLKTELYDWVGNPEVLVDGADPAEVELAKAPVVAERADLIRTAIGCALVEKDYKRVLSYETEHHEKVIAESQEALKGVEGQLNLIERVLGEKAPKTRVELPAPGSLEEIVAQKTQLFDLISGKYPSPGDFADLLEKQEKPFVLWLDPGIKADEKIDISDWVSGHKPAIREHFDRRSSLFSRASSALAFMSTENIPRRIRPQDWLTDGVVSSVIEDNNQQGLVVESLSKFAMAVRAIDNWGNSCTVALLTVASLQALERNAVSLTAKNDD